MRYFGASPAYNTAELFFRCRRIFFIAILVGGAAAAILVRLRAETYTASIIVSLAGDIDPAKEDQSVVARRRADRLAFLLHKDPNFLLDVLKQSGVLKRHPGADTDHYLAMLRSSLSSPTLGSDIYLEINIAWHDRAEAESLMKELYRAFVRQTTRSETIGVTAKRQFFDDQLREHDRKARQKELQRATYMKDVYWRKSAVLGLQLSQSDKSESSLLEAKQNLSEARSRLAGIEKELAETPPRLTSRREVRSKVDPTQSLTEQKDALLVKLRPLEDRYTDLHPEVADLKQKIKAIDDQIAEIRRSNRGRNTQTTEDVRDNPRYAELVKLRAEFTSTVGSLRVRVAELESLVNSRTQLAKSAPLEEIRFNEIQRDYRMADELRNQTAAQLASARTDEQREKQVKEKSLELVSKPRAEKMDSGPKTAFIYVLGPLAGVLFAAGLTLLTGSLDRSLRTPADIEKLLGKPVLAVLPDLESSKEGRKLLAGGSDQNRRLGK